MLMRQQPMGSLIEYIYIFSMNLILDKKFRIWWSYMFGFTSTKERLEKGSWTLSLPQSRRQSGYYCHYVVFVSVGISDICQGKQKKCN